MYVYGAVRDNGNILKLLYQEDHPNDSINNYWKKPKSIILIISVYIMARKQYKKKKS